MQSRANTHTNRYVHIRQHTPIYTFHTDTHAHKYIHTPTCIQIHTYSIFKYTVHAPHRTRTHTTRYTHIIHTHTLHTTRTHTPYNTCTPYEPDTPTRTYVQRRGQRYRQRYRHTYTVRHRESQGERQTDTLRTLTRTRCALHNVNRLHAADIQTAMHAFEKHMFVVTPKLSTLTWYPKTVWIPLSCCGVHGATLKV